jgi:hypothetical protein
VPEKSLGMSPLRGAQDEGFGDGLREALLELLCGDDSIAVPQAERLDAHQVRPEEGACQAIRDANGLAGQVPQALCVRAVGMGDELDAIAVAWTPLGDASNEAIAAHGGDSRRWQTERPGHRSSIAN